MNAVAEKELIDLVVGWVKENGLNGASHTEITESTNLLESGLLDSFGFVDLVLFIENYTQNKINLIDVNPEQFTVVKELCHLAFQEHQKNASTPFKKNLDNGDEPLGRVREVR